MPVLIAALGAYGVHLLVTHLMLGWRGIGPGPREGGRRRRSPRLRTWLVQAGLDDVAPLEFVAVLVVVAIAGGLLGAAVFGGPIAAVALASAATALPLATYRRRRIVRRAESRDAWPRVIDEIRLLVGSAGRSVPQATLDAGLEGPPELHDAFRAAQRAWHLTTDFERTLDVLRDRLADPTADAACETLLIAHQVGGTDLDRRLAALAADRREDVEARKDADARLAGVRFARRFTLIVPLGMAMAGLAIGDGRAAYATVEGQLLVVAGLAMTAVCWFWAGRIMAVREPRRVFVGSPGGQP